VINENLGERYLSHGAEPGSARPASRGPDGIRAEGRWPDRTLATSLFG
jgi:hypothetical protein